MEPSILIRQNWLTRKPQKGSYTFICVLAFLFFMANLILFADLFHASSWMPASPMQVFSQHEYWRLFSALFAHASLGHLFSNSVLFFPLMYLLVAYYGFRFFPLAALFNGGLINFLVLKTLPPETTLLGISGLVYWAGASWLTLYVLVDRRDAFRRRFAICLFLALMLFMPETYQVGISYYSHFLGFVFGGVTALLYYWVRRKTFQQAEVVEYIIEPELENTEKYLEEPSS